MGHSKKRKYPSIEEVLDRPWCYYCERDFDDLKVLMSHQKAKHYKCDKCNRRLNTAGGLAVHMSQVHKEDLKRVENALESRSGLDIEIFGMEGIPEDILREHRERKSTEYWENARERQRLTGNAVAGASGNHIPGERLKLPQKDEIKDIVKRFIEAKRHNGLSVTQGTDVDFGAVGQPANGTSHLSLASPAQKSIPGHSASPSPAIPSGPAQDHTAAPTQASQAPDARRLDTIALPADKKTKKSKDKTKLVYSSEDITPDEFMLFTLGLVLDLSVPDTNPQTSKRADKATRKSIRADTEMTG